ncbi:mycofactocin system transcriptional regulator [Antrihabitans cavernicola]|uniref:Mycofactocin system transcriptional regulator n=1 Tax=Antrihabitans cavernicola TaxID=2495913 RepID=A0A5A7S427_9NOCA|nr:mycofactocin system transcriptional regulator [Spelaeibacter cavernicola]KAA0017955.1 mycofactocin system transcriptional regulator [Spelaeibacter cavernicola]
MAQQEDSTVGTGPPPPARIGRRPATTKDDIAATALKLFATNGFDGTSIDQIADAAGIARRTFFRYFASKNAVPWGDFDVHLAEMREHLADLPSGITLADGLTAALLEFNTFPDEQAAVHRTRMELILTVPALQGYSMVMYEGWRTVIAEYVAKRTGSKPDDHGPRTAGWLVLAVAIAAYEQWLHDSSLSLQDLLRSGASALQNGLTGQDHE